MSRKKSCLSLRERKTKKGKEKHVDELSPRWLLAGTCGALTLCWRAKVDKVEEDIFHAKQALKTFGWIVKTIFLMYKTSFLIFLEAFQVSRKSLKWEIQWKFQKT